MNLINLTRVERNGKAEASPLDMLVDVCDINRPIFENIDGNTVMYVEESIVSRRQAEGINAVQYIVDEDLATVNTLSQDVFVVTVETREGREPVAGMVTLGFVSNRIVGGIQAFGAGSKFMYHEDDGSHPIEYVVSETVADIKLML